MTADRLLFALAGLAEKTLTKAAARILPWSSHSQHAAYLQMTVREGIST